MIACEKKSISDEKMSEGVREMWPGGEVWGWSGTKKKENKSIFILKKEAKPRDLKREKIDTA